MRWQTTTALAVALLLVGGFYYVYEVRWAPDRERAETRKGRVFSAEATDVTGVELKRREDTVRLTRAGEAWELKSPVVARADRARVEETLTTVLTAKVDREIDPKPAALGDFGLDKPAAEVTLTLKDGKRLGLALGNKSPTGVWVYAREAGKPAVVALSDGALREATKPATEFRDRTVLAFERGQVSGFDVTSEGETLAVTHAGEAWRITRPVTLPADTEAVGEMFEKLTAAKVKEFVAEAPRSPATYGLDRPLRLTIHTGKDKERASRTLLVGRTDTAKKGVYAKPTVKLTITEQGKPPTTVLLAPSGERRGGAPTAYAAVAQRGPVVLVDSKALDDLGRSVDDLRDHALFARLEPKDIKRLRVKAGGQTAVLERSGDTDWKLVEPTKGAAKGARVDDIVYGVRALRWKQIVAPNGEDAARYGLDAPTLEVVMFRGDGSELGLLTVGRKGAERAY